MVSVLDVLGQPVLGPVDLFTINRNLDILKDDPELVVLHLVVNTVVPRNSAEPLLLILEVVPNSLLKCGQVVCILRLLRYSQNFGKKDIMLRIKSGVLEEYIIEKTSQMSNLYLLTSVAKLSSQT